MQGGGSWGHSFQSPGALFDATGAHVGWYAGLCGEWHGPCGGTEDDAETLDLEHVMSVLAGDGVEEIKALLAAHPTRVRFIASRGAIQVRGCNGRIIGHFALSDAVLLSLLR